MKGHIPSRCDSYVRKNPIYLFEKISYIGKGEADLLLSNKLKLVLLSGWQADLDLFLECK